VIDREPKFGMAVTGLVHPDRILAKGGARAGDALIMTKALGTGVVTTAHKRDLAEAAEIEATLASMMRLNRAACEAVLATPGVHGMTDITGFGLLGHAHEMAHLANVAFSIGYDVVPWLPGAQRLAEAGVFPGGGERNGDYFGKWVSFGRGLNLPEWSQRLLHDPQTSGGLLIAVAADHHQELVQRLVEAGDQAQVLGGVVDGIAGEIRVV
jgi:selenide,water dikinase